MFVKKLKALGRWFSQVFADFRDDWRDLWRQGPQRWLRGGYSDLQDLGDSLYFWKKRVTKKVSEEERRLAKERKARAFKDSLSDTKEGIFNLLTAPWRWAVGLWKGVLNLRKKSFRDALGVIWSAYVSFLAGCVDRVTRLWRGFVNFPLWLRGGIAMALLVALTGLVASPWLIREVRDRRAQDMLAEVKAEQDGGDIIEAFRKSRAAALMRPDDPEMLETALDLADYVRSPEAVWWSERVAQVRGQNAESMSRVVETAIRHQRLEKAQESLQMMKSRFPEHANLSTSEVELLLAQKKSVEAMHRAIAALNAGADSPFLHTTAVHLGLRSSSPDVRQAMYEHLLQHLYRNDEVGLALARLVIGLGIRSSNEGDDLDPLRLIAFIESHDQANANDLVAAYGMAMQAGSLDRETAEAKIMEQFDLDDKQQVLTALRFFAGLGFYETYDRIIAPELLADPDFVLAKITGLLLREEPDVEAAEALLNGGSDQDIAPISDAARALWLAVIEDRRGVGDAMARGVVDAVDKSSRAEWGYLMETVPKVAQPAEVLRFYRKMFEHSGRHPFIAPRYLRTAYAHADEEELARIVRFIRLDSLASDPGSQALLIYLKLLYDEDSLHTIRIQAENLVAKHPNDISFLIILAHVYHQSDASDYAQRLLAFWKPGESLRDLPPILKLSYAVVTGSDHSVVTPGAFRTSRERELLQGLIHESTIHESNEQPALGG